MKFIFWLILFHSTSVFAEHEATYCGILMDGSYGKRDYYNDAPEVVLQINHKIERGESIPVAIRYAGVSGLDDKLKDFAARAIKNNFRKTNFCVKARWGGSFWYSRDIHKIKLFTDTVTRMGYMSSY
jgi:hypothetical protein